MCYIYYFMPSSSMLTSRKDAPTLQMEKLRLQENISKKCITSSCLPGCAVKCFTITPPSWLRYQVHILPWLAHSASRPHVHIALPWLSSWATAWTLPTVPCLAPPSHPSRCLCQGTVSSRLLLAYHRHGPSWPTELNLTSQGPTSSPATTHKPLGPFRC